MALTIRPLSSVTSWIGHSCTDETFVGDGYNYFSLHMVFSNGHSCSCELSCANFHQKFSYHYFTSQSCTMFLLLSYHPSCLRTCASPLASQLRGIFYSAAYSHASLLVDFTGAVTSSRPSQPSSFPYFTAFFRLELLSSYFVVIFPPFLAKIFFFFKCRLFLCAMPLSTTLDTCTPFPCHL